MCVAVGAVVAKVARKVLAILAGDKNGRKFLGYVVGIALFIVLLPVIAVYGLFGWMAYLFPVGLWQVAVPPRSSAPIWYTRQCPQNTGNAWNSTTQSFP